MLINECRPYVNRQGHLRFVIPGFRRSVGGVGPWEDGFEPCQIRGGNRAPSHHWSLTLFPGSEGRRLPGTVQGFLDEIPAEVRDQISRFRFGQVPMLHCLATSPEAVDLMLGHPMLFWLMVASKFDSDWSVEDLHELCGMRQVEILERLTGYASRAAVRLLRKVEIGEGTLGESRTILRAIGNPDIVRIAAHQETVNVRLLALLSNYPGLVEPASANVLARILSGDAGHRPGAGVDVAVRLVDISRMARALEIARPQQAIRRCRTLEDVNRLHDRWAEALLDIRRPAEEEEDEIERFLGIRHEPANRPAFLRRDDEDVPEIVRRVRRRIIVQRQTPDYSSLTFPPPPYPNSRHIRAITTPAEMERESRMQSNCARDYSPLVASGDVYLYRVLRPQRGTLEVVRRDSGWVLGQFKLKRNRDPGVNAEKKVRAWYDSVRVVS